MFQKRLADGIGSARTYKGKEAQRSHSAEAADDTRVRSFGRCEETSLHAIENDSLRDDFSIP